MLSQRRVWHVIDSCTSPLISNQNTTQMTYKRRYSRKSLDQKDGTAQGTEPIPSIKLHRKLPRKTSIGKRKRYGLAFPSARVHISIIAKWWPDEESMPDEKWMTEACQPFIKCSRLMPKVSLQNSRAGTNLFNGFSHVESMPNEKRMTEACQPYNKCSRPMPKVSSLNSSTGTNLFNSFSHVDFTNHAWMHAPFLDQHQA